MIRFHLFTIVAISALFCSSAFAGKGDKQDPEKSVERVLKKQDTNSDGVLDKTEFKGKEKGFDKLDSNSDGKLDKAELLAAAEKRAKQQEGKGEKKKKKAE